MKKLISVFVLAVTFISATPGFALLAPIYQSVKELEAILADRALFDQLKPNESIQEIKHINDSYVIITNVHQMIVDVIYIPTAQVGPQEFKLDFHAPTLLDIVN